MIILVIDTASSHCTVALIYHQSVVAHISEGMNKGHAEKLISQIEQAMNISDTTFDKIDCIAVNIGPGSFTGIRVGVSAARALALALKIPAVGISLLEALTAQAIQNDISSDITAVIEAYEGMFYCQNFSKDLIALNAPSLRTLDSVIANLPEKTTLIGPAVDAIAIHITDKTTILHKLLPKDVNVAIYAHLAMNKSSHTPPSPLYLRDAEARKQTNFALPQQK
ncbi:tRNA (adenosine(37)-N6)-threonylcarbamoyltransferase complex dimerization subunit type 1 TsaB [Bartonella ancashensis]|uniref:Putative molecular chaperone n=1 Tax=Bartonella ancashensis TaxID=1318743 RepID=A0A0M4L6Q6_9HYPH|nr:tRNA (adenosine(37)-N6)-threonylcarbamoyltransferase complex dimerization subunit type 1 TsaB [Bartonella ancashensis]ALE03408.1 Putative molecular chaperone [Bartonella ancashensis]